LSLRFRLALFALPTLLLAGCGQTAAPPPATPTRPPAAAAPATVQVPSGLPPLAKPAASPSAAASPAAQVAPGPNAGKQFAAAPAMQIDPSKRYTATLTTSLGTMKADLFPSDAPITVNNFVFLARQGFYEGLTFHRVISGFMAQGGDPTGAGAGGPGYKFNDEPVTRNYDRGTLAMANSGPNTNGSQFFIVQQVYNPPTKAYTIFGKLTDGLDTLDKIVTSPNGPGKGGPNTPLTPITITSIKIDET
jgi:cyclophilin family peptidyl-prolyl cis-trans isomerase